MSPFSRVGAPGSLYLRFHTMADTAPNDLNVNVTSTDTGPIPLLVEAGLLGSQDSTISLHQTPSTNGGSSITSNTACVQTTISVMPGHNFVTFSAKTCAELLPSLTEEQLAFEINFHKQLGRNLDYKIDHDIDVDFHITSDTSKSTKIDSLRTAINARIMDEFSETFHECESYSYLTHDLLKSIEAAKSFISELAQTSLNKNEPDEAAEIFYDCLSNENQLPTPINILDVNVGQELTVDGFLGNIDFRTIGGRKVAHFGPEEYHYSGVAHPPCSYPDCAALDTVRSRLETSVPQEAGFDKDNWCCLVTLYEDGKAYIPPHSDNEESIVPGSDIFTVSIGETRTIEYQNILGPLIEKQQFDLLHGSVHQMSQSSQNYWEHGIPPSKSSDCGPRISLTFRNLQKSKRPTIPPISQPTTQSSHKTPPQPTRPKRLLLLSDSIHLTFPTHLFDQKSVICIKKRLPNFCLNDIHQFGSEFGYTDYVFISCGVNDLSRYGWNSHNLFTYFRDLMHSYQKRFPKTTFIFNSLLTTNYGWLNTEILSLNYSVFNLSLHQNSNLFLTHTKLPLPNLD